MADLIYNAPACRACFRIPRSQILAVAGAEDSNASQTDPSNSPDTGEQSGWLDAYPRLMADAWGSAGAGPVGLYANLSAFNGFAGGGFGLTDATASVPAPHTGVLLPEFITGGDGVAGAASGYRQQVGVAYVANGATIASTSAHWLAYLEPDEVLVDTSEAFTVVHRYRTFATGGPGAFRPAARRDGQSTIAGGTASAINPVTGSNGNATLTYNIAAASRPWRIVFEPGYWFTQDWVGPGIVLSTQLIRTGVTTGISSAVWTYQGGLGGVEAAASVMEASDAALAEKIYSHVLSQEMAGQTPALLLQWMHGGNDQNDAGQASWNPDTLLRTGVSSATATGAYNNCLAWYRRIRNIWTGTLGYSANRLFLAIGPYHETVLNGTLLTQYENAYAGICDLYPNTAWLTRGTEIFDKSTFDLMDWFRDSAGEDSDTAHLRRAGYMAAAMAAVGAWRAVESASARVALVQVGANVLALQA